MHHSDELHYSQRYRSPLVGRLLRHESRLSAVLWVSHQCVAVKYVSVCWRERHSTSVPASPWGHEYSRTLWAFAANMNSLPFNLRVACIVVLGDVRVELFLHEFVRFCKRVCLSYVG